MYVKNKDSYFANFMGYLSLVWNFPTLILATVTGTYRRSKKFGHALWYRLFLSAISVLVIALVWAFMVLTGFFAALFGYTVRESKKEC